VVFLAEIDDRQLANYIIVLLELCGSLNHRDAAAGFGICGCVCQTGFFLFHKKGELSFLNDSVRNPG